MFESPSNFRFVVDTNSSQDRHFNSPDNLLSFVTSPSVRNEPLHANKSITCKKIEQTVKIPEQFQINSSDHDYFLFFSNSLQITAGFRPQSLRVDKIPKKLGHVQEKPVAGDKKLIKGTKKEGPMLELQGINGMYNKINSKSLKSLKSPLNRANQTSMKSLHVGRTEKRTINPSPSQNRQNGRLIVSYAQQEVQKSMNMTLQSGLSSNNLRNRSPKNVSSKEGSRERKSKGAGSKLNVNIEELVKNNAKKLLEDLKREREREESNKRIEQEKQMQLKLESRRVRFNNLKHFGLSRNRKQQQNFPWGTDQRRLVTSPKSTSQERNSRERSSNTRKLTEEERRSNIGTNVFHSKSEKRIFMKKKDHNHLQEQDSRAEKHPKRASGSSPQTRTTGYQDINSFVREKRNKLSSERTTQTQNKNEDKLRIQGNLEKLSTEAKERLSHSRSPKNGKILKKKRRITSSADFQAKKGSVKNSQRDRKFMMLGGNFVDIKTEESLPRDLEEGHNSSYLSFNLAPVEDDNYSLLYDEFKRIMTSKQKFPGLPQDQRIQTDPGYIENLNPMHHRTLTTAESFPEKHEMLKKKYQELSGQYERAVKQSLTSRHSETHGSSRAFSNRNKPSENIHRKEAKGRNSKAAGSAEHGQHKGKLIVKQEQNEHELKDFLEAELYDRSDQHVVSNREKELSSRYRQELEYEDIYNDENLDVRDLEIIEAAAIFIQKNYRGYLTRKLLRDYFEKLCNEEEESQLEFDRDDFERHSNSQRNYTVQHKPHHQKNIKQPISSQAHHQNREEEHIENYQDPDAHALLVRKLLEQAQTQQALEQKRNKSSNTKESKPKDSRGENEYIKPRSSEGSGHERNSEKGNQQDEGDSQNEQSVEAQTLSLVDLIERQKEEMRTMAKRYRDEEIEKDLMKKPERNNKEENLPNYNKSLPKGDVQSEQLPRESHTSSKSKSRDPIVIYDGSKKVGQQPKSREELSQGNLKHSKGKDDVDTVSENVSLYNDNEGDLRNRYLQAHYDEALELGGTNTNIPTEILDNKSTGSQPQQQHHYAQDHKEESHKNTSNNREESSNQNLIAHFFEAKQRIEDGRVIINESVTKTEKTTKTAPISLSKDANNNNRNQWQTQTIPEYKDLVLLKKGGSPRKDMKREGQDNEDENFQDNYLAELEKLERMQEQSSNFVADRLGEEELQKSQNESDPRIVVHYESGGSDYNHMMGNAGDNLGEKMIVISTIQSDASNENMLDEGANNQLKHYNSPLNQVASPIAEANELSPIEKASQRSPFNSESGQRSKRNYEKVLFLQQMQAVPAYNQEENEESSSLLRRAKAKSNPESLGETQQAIEKLFGSSDKNDSGQKFEFEYKHRRQKSATDYNQNNLIGARRILDRISEEVNRVESEGFENEHDQLVDQSVKQIASQKKVDPEKGDHEIQHQEFLKLEESAGRIEEGMRQWLEGNLNNNETDHDEELKGFDSDRLMKNHYESQEAKNSPAISSVRAPNNKLSEEMGKLKEEQVVKWDDIINQITLLRQNEGDSLTHSALSMIEMLQQKLEANKKLLEETIKSDSHTDITLSNRANFKQPPNTEVSPAIVPSSTDKSRKSKNIPPVIKPKNLLDKFDSLDAGDLKLSSPIKKPKVKSENQIPNESLKKKGALLIDTEMINDETSPTYFKNQPRSTRSDGNSIQALSLDLSQMRGALGSEQLVRERLNSPTLQENLNEGSEVENERLSTEGKEIISIFEQNPFKNFTERKTKEFLRQDNMEQVINMREQVLDHRHKTQIDQLNQELKSSRVSPRTFQAKRVELDNWMSQEKKQLQLSKQALQKGWKHFNDTVKRTQRDLLFMKRIGSPSGEKKLNLTDFNYVPSYGSLADEDMQNQLNLDLHGNSMPILEDEMFLFSDRDVKMRRKVVSPSGAKNIKIVNDFEFENNLGNAKPNNNGPLVSPCRDNFEDAIKDRAEKGKESPVFFFPREGDSESGRKALNSNKSSQDPSQTALHKQKKAREEQAQETAKGEASKQAAYYGVQVIEERKDRFESREDYEKHYENFLKTLAKYNDTKPLDEADDHAFFNKHATGYLSANLGEGETMQVSNKEVLISAKEDIFYDNNFQLNDPLALSIKEEIPKLLSEEAELQAVVSQTIDWCIQRIERENMTDQSSNQREAPAFSTSKLSDLIEKQNKIESINLNKINEIASTKLLANQEKIPSHEKNYPVLLEPSPTQNEIGIPTSIAAVRDYLDFLCEMIKSIIQL